MDNIIYNDYASWLIESDELLNKLKEEAPFIYQRYQHIFEVVTYVYNLKVDGEELSEDEEDIFALGFGFLFEQTDSINMLCKSFFESNFKALAKEVKSVSLYLDLQELIKDLESLIDDEDEIAPLKELEDEIYDNLKNKTKLREDIYEEFNVKTMNIYRNNDLNFYPVKEIFFEIADLYNLI